MTAPSSSRGAAPWLEGAILATLVGTVLVMGGEAVRASYHGYLHTTIGQTVLRDGLLPENPYHAGNGLRYYTLYPTLGALLGRLGAGPIWGFAWLNILSALLFAPASDAFARASGLTFSQRRATFLTAVLGFNALGWVGWMVASHSPEIQVPVFALESMSWGGHAWAWDARLQSFLPKFLNVSSFALALPFMLWAMAPAMAREGRAVQILAPLGVALAINPLAGGFAVLCIAMWQWRSLFHQDWRQKLAWPFAGVLAGLCALPFLLPLFQSAPSAQSLTGTVRFQHDGLMNFFGPMALLLVPGFLGIWQWKSGERNRLLFALVLAIFITAFATMPWGNQYKLARISGLLWAIPVGRWLGLQWEKAGKRRWLPVAFIGLSLPSLVLVVQAYLSWGGVAQAAPLVSGQGTLQLRQDLKFSAFPPSILEAESSAPADAVLWMHPNHVGARASNGVVQGNALTPLFSHSLFVDLPQIHNNQIADLEQRIQLCGKFWQPSFTNADGKIQPANPQQAELMAAAALRDAQAILPQRSLLVLTYISTPWTATVLENAGASKLASESELSLWLVPGSVNGAGN
ncbi:MAG: hypothetical protein H8E15_13775 [Planctomycetes bacterium]|nr:hypothetical protein [Planctomycetota bacterium]